MFAPHASEFEQNHMVQTTQTFELFQKTKKIKTIFEKVLMPFWKMFL